MRRVASPQPSHAVRRIITSARVRWSVGVMALMVVLLVAGMALAQADDAPVYLDPAQPVPERVADLLSRMTLAEKAGQMTQINLTRLMGSGEWDRGPLDEAWVRRTLVDAHVGSLLSGGGAAPVPNEPEAWAETVNELQRVAVEDTRLGVPILYGVDAVHGHNNVLGATTYPHQIGLAASFDRDLVADVAEATARDVAATGIHWNFAPVADLGRDPRWGRFYETFGESPAVASALVAAHVDAQQGVPRVAATAKHFVGYGQAESGLDRAPADLSLRALRQDHLPPFAAAIGAGVRTVMVNSGSVNGVPVHASRWLLTDVLRGELGFSGVVLSDWADIDKLLGVHRVAASLEDAVAMAVNAGVDVVMVPHDAAGFTTALIAQVEAGAVSEARIDEAAGRVLALKFELGLFEEPYVDAADAAQIVETERDLARRAAAAGLTLLSNRRGALPLDGPLRVVVTGPAATSVPIQMGGWTILWQGLDGSAETPPAVTVLEALQATAPEGVDVAWYELGSEALHDAARAADAVVLVVGEPPYAEGAGDAAEPRLPESQEAGVEALLAALEGSRLRLATVLVAGRPLVLPEALHQESDALLLAYLPGSEGGSALADVLYGRSSPAGRLPFTWPASVGQIPIAADALPAEAQRAARYDLGAGISYASFRYRDVEAELGDDGVVLSVEVENASDLASDHVVLAWVSYPVGPVMRPVRELVGFTRAGFAAGEARTIRVVVPFEALAVVPGDVPGDAARVVSAGTYQFEVGRQRISVELPERSVPW